jgi:hypothetical protein
MSKFIDFEFKFRLWRTIYILILAGLVYMVSDSILAGIITTLALIDIVDELGEDDDDG